MELNRLEHKEIRRFCNFDIDTWIYPTFKEGTWNLKTWPFDLHLKAILRIFANHTTCCMLGNRSVKIEELLNKHLSSSWLKAYPPTYPVLHKINLKQVISVKTTNTDLLLVEGGKYWPVIGCRLTRAWPGTRWCCPAPTWWRAAARSSSPPSGSTHRYHEKYLTLRKNICSTYLTCPVALCVTSTS